MKPEAAVLIRNANMSRTGYRAGFALEADWESDQLGRLCFRATQAGDLCQGAAMEIHFKRHHKPDEVHESSKLWRALDNLTQARKVIDSLTKEIEAMTEWSAQRD
ncbi:MAG: hypothetical protein NTV11_20315 [Rhodocyclales bacterium]|nr:hypothetical protein [Rhodocyclales bacterium]